MFIIYNIFLSYFIILLIILFNILTLSFTDFFILWLFLEMTNLFFISLMSMTIINKKSIFFYFLIQVISSLTLIFSFSFNLFYLNNYYFNLIIINSLILKMGLPPFHYWLNIFFNNLNWNLLLILLTIQKIIPLYMISFFPFSFYIFFIIILCSIIPPIILINNFNFKKIIFYSSINQSSWMLLLIYFKSSIWLIYFLFYSSLLFFISQLMILLKMFMNFFSIHNMNKFIFYNYLLLILNLLNIPPFPFFLFKWYSIFIFLINSNFYLIILIMIMSSFIMFYNYLNLFIFNSSKWNMKSKILFSKFQNLSINMQK